MILLGPANILLGTTAFLFINEVKLLIKPLFKALIKCKQV